MRGRIETSQTAPSQTGGKNHPKPLVSRAFSPAFAKGNAMNARAQIRQMIGDNKEHIASRLSDFWRRWAEDLIAAGIPANEVTETMVAVAVVQVMKVHGSTRTAESFRRMADSFQMAADAGCEYPATEH